MYPFRNPFQTGGLIRKVCGCLKIRGPKQWLVCIRLPLKKNTIAKSGLPFEPLRNSFKVRARAQQIGPHCREDLRVPQVGKPGSLR